MPLLRTTLKRQNLVKATNSIRHWKRPQTTSTARERLEPSFVEGPKDPPLIQKTLPTYFAQDILARFAKHSALIARHDPIDRFPGPRQKHPSKAVHWTFAEFDDRIVAAARGLLRLGITKGDRVAVIMGNNSVYAILQWACARIGAILVTVNPAYRITEIIRTLNAVQVKALVVVPQMRSSKYVDLLVSSVPSLATFSRIEDPAIPSLKQIIVADNCADPHAFEAELGKVKAAIPFGDILVFNDSEANTAVNNLTDSLDQHDVINLQFTSGTTGSPIPIDLMKQLIKKLNLRDLTIAYGMTETSPVSFQTTPADPIEKRVETVGKIQPHVKAKVIDESGKIVPVGEYPPTPSGHSGYNVQKGYWEDPEQTSKVMHPDPQVPGRTWMHTGDTAIMDEEGYIRIVGRIKDLIIRGGENLFPVQIENVLTEHPSINEAAVVSVPDPRYGEVVGAWIARQADQPAVTRDEIRSWVAKQMNPQNAPAWVWFLGEEGVETELPKTASGKVQKNILRERSKIWAQKGIGQARSQS
ncbi:hypothetical protein FRB90_006277 [Tulasnella sp. 427]|nr:hypothetical protein FRB90_006277 [Tulasnella sp. 427]